MFCINQPRPVVIELETLALSLSLARSFVYCSKWNIALAPKRLASDLICSQLEPRVWAPFDCFRVANLSLEAPK